MNGFAKGQWVDALRSGKFQQGRNRLCAVKDGTRCYCCLGVLAQLAADSGVINEPKPTKDGLLVYDGSWWELSQGILFWARLEDLQVTIRGVTCSLNRHNDQGVSFTEIADAIENQL